MAVTDTKTENKRMTGPMDLVFVKVVPSGKFECRMMEVAYMIYNPQTRKRTGKNFIFYHRAGHPVYRDTFNDYHMAPTEGDGRSLLQLCKDKTIATMKVQEFCEAFTADLQETFGSSTRRITFIGDHIYQTRAYLYPFMFCQHPWIQTTTGVKRPLIDFVEFRTFMQPFAALHQQMNEPFELPQWVFRAFQDVNAQVNFFDAMIQSALRRSPLADATEPGELLYCSNNKCVNFVADENKTTTCETTGFLPGARVWSSDLTPVKFCTCVAESSCCDNQECDNYAPKYCGATVSAQSSEIQQLCDNLSGCPNTDECQEACNGPCHN